MLQPATTQPAQRRDPSQSQESPSPEDGDDDGGDYDGGNEGDDDAGGDYDDEFTFGTSNRSQFTDGNNITEDQWLTFSMTMQSFAFEGSR